MITLNNGVHQYPGASHPTLDGLSLHVPRGEKLALIGRSGCGKTTLLRCLNALETLQSGELIVNGTRLPTQTQPLPGINLARFRSQVGIVFQQFNLFPHMTVLQNITLGPVQVLKHPREQAETVALNLLEQVGLHHKAMAYPETLSGGQQQRVALVRSMAMQPKLLLLDEPTSALDPMMAQEVWMVLSELLSNPTEEGNTPANGLTMVVVSHAWRFVAQIADRVAFMENGTLIETGTPDQLQHQPQHPGTQAFMRAL